MEYDVCEDCSKHNDCRSPCAALGFFIRYVALQRDDDKREYLRSLSKDLLDEAEVSPDMEALGVKVIDHFPFLSYLSDVKIAYVVSHERKVGAKTIYADCRKIQGPYKAFLPYEFMITFYDYNTSGLSDNQIKVLMLHELSHIGISRKGYKIVGHDIEDFKSILSAYGLEWTGYDAEIPDILENNG